MSKFVLALAAAGLLSLATAPVGAEEGHGDKAAAVAAPEVKKEAQDAMAVGTKGSSEGVILSLEKGKLVLQTADGNLLFMPSWKGGAPKDGGGFDKDVLKSLEQFKVGDKVRIAWSWNERRRIEQIAAAK